MPQSNSFLLVYGSQTGQAQSIAEQIAEKSAVCGLKAKLHCLDQAGKEQFDIEDESCMVMVTSTTGDGDAPDNASKFLRKIKKKTLSSDYLSHLHYSILGLGDTNYNNFCKCARDMDSRLEQLGAKRFYPTGLADDGVGLELVADPWLEGLYPVLTKFLGLSSHDNTAEISLSERVSALNVKDEIDLVNQSNNYNSDVTDSRSLNGKVTELDNEDILPLDSNGDVDKISGVVYCNGDISIAGHDSLDKVISQETKCIKIDLTIDGELNSNCMLKKHSESLVDRGLTIPLLAPEFIQASFGHERFQTLALPFQNGCKLPCASSDIIQAHVSHAKVLTQTGAAKKTLWLRLSLKDQKDVYYSPGDAISVICENNGSEVQLLLDRLGATNLSDQEMSISLISDTKKRRAAVPPHIHTTTTLRHLLKTCVNIRDPPSKAFLRVLVEHTKDDKEVRRLQELCSKEGAEEYTKCLREKSVSLLDILYAFPSCQPPVERVLEFLPRLLPRPYSICSCPETDPDSLGLVFNVIDIQGDVSDGRFYHRRGVCTGWLDDITSSLQEPDNSITEDVKIPIFFRTNQHFRPPSDLSKPLILIGPGTGVAPFIGFLQQRALRKSKLGTEDKYGQTWLFSGCRKKDKDFIFSKEIEQFVATRTLDKLCACFSRDPDSTYRYVQDYMRSESSHLARLIDNDEGLVYVCGDGKNMAKNVNAAFEEILMSEKELSADEAHAFMMKKRLHKSYLEDVWT